MPSEYTQMDAKNLARKLAIANQALTEKDLLIRHHQIALDLVGSTPGQRDQLISRARATVARWRLNRLCSLDHIERWNEILNMEPNKMATTMVSAIDGWGPALRQNSPWVGYEEEPTVGVKAPNSPAHLYGVLTAQEMADHLKCSPESVSERAVAGEFIFLSSPSRTDDRRYPAFQLDGRVDKSLLRQTIQQYRDADVDPARLWSFLRAPQKIYAGLTAIEMLLGGMPPQFGTLTPEDRSEIFLDVVAEEISRVRW